MYFMPYVTVTQELGKIIKSERQSRNIFVKDIIPNIKKSLAYFSKIENAKVDKIELSTLYTIFENIIEKENFNTYMSNLLQKVTIGLTEEEIKNEEWMHTFDMQYREIPISEEICNFIHEKLKTRSISAQDVIKRLNKNEALDSQEQYEDNQVYAKYDNDGAMTSSIKFNLPDDFLDDILSGKIDTINYINMLGIIYVLFRFEGFSDKESMEKSQKYLYENKFYTLLEKNRLLRDASKNGKVEIDSVLSPEDKEYLSISRDVSKKFKLLSDQNIKYANSKLKIFNENLRDEPGITFAIIGLPLSNLKGISKDTKKQFIQDIKALINKYSTEEKSDIELID